MKADEMVEGVRLHIMELDPLRLPLSWGLYPHHLSTFIEFLFKNKERSFVKNDHNLYQAILKEMNPYRTDMQTNPKDLMLITLNLIFMLLFIVISSFISTIIFSFSYLQTIVFSVIIAIPSIYIYLVWLIMRRRHFLGEKHDENLKKTVQMLIEYGLKSIRNEELDPKDYPIRLRHDDYEGLIYEKKGKNDYVGFFKK